MRLGDADDASAAAPRTCCVGEQVGLDVELSNPLQLDLALTRLRLACSWEPSTPPGSAATAVRSSPDGSTDGSVADGSGRQQGFQVSKP